MARIILRAGLGELAVIPRGSLIVLAVLAASGSPVAGQSNDNCSGAIAVAFPSVTSGNTSAATTTPGQTCPVTKELWYSFVAPSNGTAVASTSALSGGSADFNTVISAYTFPAGAPCVLASGQLIGCNDNSFGSPQSLVVFATLSGAAYFVAVGGSNGATGNFALSVTSLPVTNDFCAGALPITAGVTVTGTNIFATTGNGDPVPTCPLMSHDVWYSFVAPSCGTYTVTTCPGSDYDTIIAVWQGSCGSLTEVACNDDFCAAPQNLNSTLSFPGIMGTTYFIALGGYGHPQGQPLGFYSLSITFAPPPPMALSFFNNGPGTIGYSVANGPPNGLAFTALTLAQGAYPNGWLYGLDIMLADLFSQWSTGFPFVVPVALCVSTTVGPFGPLPPGLTVYGVSFGVPNGGAVLPTVFTLPATGTVP